MIRTASCGHSLAIRKQNASHANNPTKDVAAVTIKTAIMLHTVVFFSDIARKMGVDRDSNCGQLRPCSQPPTCSIRFQQVPAHRLNNLGGSLSIGDDVTRLVGGVATFLTVFGAG